LQDFNTKKADIFLNYFNHIVKNIKAPLSDGITEQSAVLTFF
jgi:hypothetical protein